MKRAAIAALAIVTLTVVWRYRDVLNDNAGAITALATVVLAILTFRYIREVRRLAEADERRRREETRRSLNALARKLLRYVESLPANVGVPVAVTHLEVWETSDIYWLEAWASAIGKTEIDLARSAAESLHWLGRRIAVAMAPTVSIGLSPAIGQPSGLLGFGWGSPQRQQWDRNRGIAHRQLVELEQLTQGEAVK